MNNLSILKAYPLTFIASITSINSLFPFNHAKQVLSTAVTELGRTDRSRMIHVQGVAQALSALATNDLAFFYDQLSPNLTCNRNNYMDGLLIMHDLYKKLDPAHKEILELAVLAHDLGVPLGNEWDHPLNSSLVAQQLVTIDEYKKPVSLLTLHHGNFSNLIASSFPQDIYQLPRDLIPLLLLLDFCDATSRVTKDHELENPIGLDSLDFFTNCAYLNNLQALEDPEKLFILRSRHGFGVITFPKTLSQEDIEAISAIPGAVKFLGGILRCQFLDILLSSLDTPAERAQLIAILIDIYQKNFSDAKQLWLKPSPNIDLGRMIKQDKEGFISAFKTHIQLYGFNGLFTIDLKNNEIIFLD